MSHISRIKTQMVDKEFVLKALSDLGYQFEEDPEKIKQSQKRFHADILVQIPFSYDIGLLKKGETYEIVADWWGVRPADRKKLTGALLQRYAYHATVARLEEQGFSLVNEETSNNGEIRLVLRRMA